MLGTLLLSGCSQTQNNPALGKGVSQVQNDTSTLSANKAKVGAHTHPANECTNSISHTHPNGKSTHNHQYSCKGVKKRTSQKKNPNAHRHPANKCTRSIMHAHPNGKNKHSHRYSCQNNAVKGTITSTVRRYKN